MGWGKFRIFLSFLLGVELFLYKNWVDWDYIVLGGILPLFYVLFYFSYLRQRFSGGVMEIREEVDMSEFVYLDPQWVDRHELQLFKKCWILFWFMKATKECHLYLNNQEIWVINKTIGFFEPIRELGNEATRLKWVPVGDRPLQGEMRHMNCFSIGRTHIHTHTHRSTKRKAGIFINYWRLNMCYRTVWNSWKAHAQEESVLHHQLFSTELLRNMEAG